MQEKLKNFVQTVKGQNILFWKKILGFRNMQEKFLNNLIK
jgi:hypothetical protein